MMRRIRSATLDMRILLKFDKVVEMGCLSGSPSFFSEWIVIFHPKRMRMSFFRIPLPNQTPFGALQFAINQKTIPLACHFT